VVSIGKLSADQGRYYLDQAGEPTTATDAVTSGAEEYYVGGPEAAGEWLGHGAASLRLSGAVTGEALTTLLAGIDPSTGESLRRSGSVAAFDVTFSAPKSVSVAFAIGDPFMQRAIREAHRAAVLDAFTYFERATSYTRRGEGGAISMRGEGLVAAAFEHRTSRAGDPQLHTHVLVANAIRGEDGRWSALDGRRLYAHARTAGFLYQASLRRHLTRELGVRWTGVEKGVAEIEGISERVRRAFSTRRAEIEAAMARAGSSGRDAAQVAALATRRAKDRSLTPDQLRSEWCDRAARLGLLRARSLCGRAAPQETDFTAALAALLSPDGLTRDQSSFGEREVVQALCEAARAGATVGEIEGAAQRLLECDQVVTLAGATRTVEPQYSTVELLDHEREILAVATELRGAQRAVAPSAAVASALERRPYLSAEQRDLVARLATAGDGVAVVIGRAGAGKTTALAAACEAWEVAGVPVVGTAVARRAAKELSDRAGIKAMSVEALLRRSEPLPPGAVLLVDEASMLGTRQFARLLERVRAAEGKLVIVGDPSQLQSIEAGGALKSLCRRIDPIVLKNNRRQREAWERRAVALVRDGAAPQALALYAGHDRLHVGESDHEVKQALIDRWRQLDAPVDALLIAHSRRDVADINGRARAVLKAEGRLGDAELWGEGGAFSVGDVVSFRVNSSRHDVRNGDRGVVTQVDPARRALTVDLDGRTIEVDGAFLARRTRHRRPALEHGYATTAHAAQGSTCRHTLVLARDDTYREWAYSALTRATEGSHLFVVATPNRDRDEIAPPEAAADARVALAAALTRERAEELAIERLHIERWRSFD
jgi:conjugative relaxase-like TrwC/TraI family protein